MAIHSSVADHKDAQERKDWRGRLNPCAGFSLLEMLVSILVLLIIAGGVISIIGYSQKSYAGTELRSDMYENVRGVAEMMEQEIGQAGLVNLPSPSPTLSAAINTINTSQTVNVSSTASMYVGQQVLVDASVAKEELVTLTGVTATTITAVFTKTHAANVPLTVLGVFPNGIMPPTTASLATCATYPAGYPGATDGSTCTTLNLFGDLNGDGTLVYVRYICNTAVTPGTLTRSTTTITPGVTTIGAAQTLLSTLIANPSGTPCFQYTVAGPSGTLAAPQNYFVTNVSITLSVQATRPDPQTLAYPTMTKSFLYLAPRNVLAGYEQAAAGNNSRLQASPTNVTSY
jgi:prepilin-type N-terminal cleavage/methylation domain-containing protein